MTTFEGIVPAIITPMNSEGGLNEQAFRDVMDFNIRSGVHGFWIAGGTGESILLSDEENKRIADIASDQNQGRINNIMHVGAPTTVRAARLAEHAARSGVEAICCIPPFFYQFSDEEIVEHYRTVAAASDLPLFVYNLPSSTGVEITPGLMKKIQDGVPQLAGLKHSSSNLEDIRVFSDMGLRAFIGSSMRMLPALTIGAAGCVDGPPCAAPELWVELWHAYIAKDLARAEKAQMVASDFAEILVKDGFHANIKAFISHRLGIDCGAPRPPGSAAPAARIDSIIARATELRIGQINLAEVN